MKISSVKLLNNGLKGVDVSYETTSVKGGREFNNEIKKKHKSPVHEDLMKLFKSLDFYVKDIFGLTTQDVEVTGVTYGNKGFIVSSKITVDSLVIPKVSALNTPLVSDADDYFHYKDVCAILDAIYAETEAFISGEKVMNDKQLVMSFYEAKKVEMDYEGMTNEEIQQAATAILEKMGSIVIHNEDMDVSTIDVSKEVEATKKTAIEVVLEKELPVMFIDSKELNDEAVVLPTFEDKPSAFDPTQTFAEDLGYYEQPVYADNVLIPKRVVAPVKESTAKKLTKVA